VVAISLTGFLSSVYITISDLETANVEVDNKLEMYQLGMKTVIIKVNTPVPRFRV
jgi:hypothetical protein